jgi:hypothetical protein
MLSKYSKPLSIELTQEYISLIASAVIKPFFDTTRDIKGLDALSMGFYPLSQRVTLNLYEILIYV